MPEVLRITNWEKNFENSKTRLLKKLSWIPLPNRLDSDGYVELLDHEDGAAHFGVWIVLLEMASRCDHRGTFVRDSGTTVPDSSTPVPDASTSVPDSGALISISALAKRARMPVALFDNAVSRLVQIGWLEYKTLKTNDMAPQCQIPAPKCREPVTERMKERKKVQNERKKESTPPPPKGGRAQSGFDAFWDAYPKKRSKQQAEKAWQKLQPGSNLQATILSALSAQKAWPDWEKDAGQFIPLGSTWINQRRWEDEAKIETAAREPAAKPRPDHTNSSEPPKPKWTLKTWLKGRNDEFDWKFLFDAIRELVDPESFKAWFEPLRPAGHNKDEGRIALYAPSISHRDFCCHWEMAVLGDLYDELLKRGFPAIEILVADFEALDGAGRQDDVKARTAKEQSIRRMMGFWRGREGDGEGAWTAELQAERQKAMNRWGVRYTSDGPIRTTAGEIYEFADEVSAE